MSKTKIKNLTDREALVLNHTVASFIDYSTPISSAFLKTRFGYPFSAATIRSVLSRLEEKGYLAHPHTSSGRIPTDLGYRFYVDSLKMESKTFNALATDLPEELLRIATDVDDLLSGTAVMLSKISKLFGIVMVSRYKDSILSDLELVPIHSNRVMLVLAMQSGFVRSIVLNLDVDVKSRHLDFITTILKEKLVGLSLSEIQSTITERLTGTEIFNHEVVQVLVNNSRDHFDIDQNKLMYTSSPNALLQQPEFQDAALIQRILPALEKGYLTEYFRENILNKKSCTLIGEETGDDLLNNCAIITTSFKTETVRGRLGIVGPTRLHYQTIKELLNNFAEIMPSVL